MKLYSYPIHAIKILIMFYLVKGFYNAINNNIRQFYKEIIEHKEMWYLSMTDSSKKRSIVSLVHFLGDNRFYWLTDEINMCFIIQSK